MECSKSPSEILSIYIIPVRTLRVTSCSRIARSCSMDNTKSTRSYQYEVATKQNPVSVLSTNNEVHHHDVQIQVRQLEHEADASFCGRQRELLSRSQEGNQALEDQREKWVTEVQQYGDEMRNCNTA